MHFLDGLSILFNPLSFIYSNVFLLCEKEKYHQPLFSTTITQQTKSPFSNHDSLVLAFWSSSHGHPGLGSGATTVICALVTALVLPELLTVPSTHLSIHAAVVIQVAVSLAIHIIRLLWYFFESCHPSIYSIPLPCQVAPVWISHLWLSEIVRKFYTNGESLKYFSYNARKPRAFMLFLFIHAHGVSARVLWGSPCVLDRRRYRVLMSFGL
ncbi:hypothetical protein BDA99DRAFT_533417 [Phascolomyces articulosus]|uniref:Uncharacterized protein n=1 Tax=Phascolomyces articulosus TaxID=60185 RepID=A0AAD5KSI4_9FUNG|nr:hypothetical protein BDA99DRAFT_533417 [Phascolomyces articulosus]